MVRAGRYRQAHRSSQRRCERGLASYRLRILDEVGLLILYCRPYSGRDGRRISPSPGLSDELYADYIDHRRVRDFRSPTGIEVLRNFEKAQVYEEWDSLTDLALTLLRELASVHHLRVTAEMGRNRARLPRTVAREF